MINKALHDEKENISFFGNGLENRQPNLKYPSIQLLAAANNQKKANKLKVKAPKNVTTNVRAGDWVCLVCNNLNFSFRNECNRCQMQTKKQNYIQSLLLISDGSKLENSPKRAALKDVTNQQLNSLRPIEMQKTKSTPPQTHYKAERQSFSKDFENVPKYNQNRFVPDEASFHSYSGFGNMLLVTPPKSKGNRDSIIFKEYFDSNQKIFPPYKSPEQLPSMSPMLRKIGHQEEAMLREMSNLGLGNMPHMNENLQYRLNQNVRAFDQDDEVDKMELRDISNYFKQSLGNVQNNCETPNFYSSNGSPELQKDNSFFSIMEGGEFNPICGGEDLYSGNPVEDDHFKQKERKSDWHCNKCGNLNYSFRKFCNRCQVLR